MTPPKHPPTTSLKHLSRKEGEMGFKDNCKNCGAHRSQLSETPYSTKISNGVWGIICKPCSKKEIDDKIEKFAESEESTDYEDDIVCPHCGTRHDSDGESQAFYADGEHDFTCGYCSNEFKVSTDVSYSYSSSKI